MNKRAILIGVVLALLVAVFAVYSFSTSSPQNFSLAHIERADNAEARERGLSGRASIPEEFGMLFVFDDPGSYGFWMKDMLTSIDIIWLSEDGKILGIEESVSPDSYPLTYYPPTPVSRVLETRGGEAARKGWEVGTMLVLPE